MADGEHIFDVGDYVEKKVYWGSYPGPRGKLIAFDDEVFVVEYASGVKEIMTPDELAKSYNFVGSGEIDTGWGGRKMGDEDVI